MDSVRERVERGVRWLDENVKRWWERIELKEFSISSGCSCVLGQVFRDDAKAEHEFLSVNTMITRLFRMSGLVSSRTVRLTKYKPGQGEIVEIVPMKDQILVKRCEQENEKNGLVLPDVSKKKMTRGVVTRLGDGRTCWTRKLEGDGTPIPSGHVAPFQVRIGDLVLFNHYGGRDFTVEGEDVLLINEQEIMAVLEEV